MIARIQKQKMARKIFVGGGGSQTCDLLCSCLSDSSVLPSLNLSMFTELVSLARLVVKCHSLLMSLYSKSYVSYLTYSIVLNLIG